MGQADEKAASERDAEHLGMLNELQALDPSEHARVSDWWWQVSETERDFTAGLSAAAARQFIDPQTLYALWRRDFVTDAERLYIEDLIARVERHLRMGTGARRLK